jgi:hypothetical protein
MAREDTGTVWFLSPKILKGLMPYINAQLLVTCVLFFSP